MNFLVHQPFDFSVSLRVAWSIFWRMVLIGALIGIVVKLALPPSAIEMQIDALVSQEPKPTNADIRAYLATVDYRGSAYAYHMFKALLPIVLATFVAAGFVFKKRYRNFALRVVNLQGETISTLGQPALCIGTVFLLPTIFFGLVSYIIGALIPELRLSSGFMMVSVLAGTAVLLYNAHLSVHWKYRRFRVVVERTA